MSWRDNIQKLSHGQLKDLVVLCSGTALLVGVAVFLSASYFSTDSVSVALRTVPPGSQTACTIFGSGCDPTFPIGLSQGPAPSPGGTTQLYIECYFAACGINGGRFGPYDGTYAHTTHLSPNTPVQVVTDPIFGPVTYTVSSYSGSRYGPPPLRNAASITVSPSVSGPPPIVTLTGNGQSDPNSITVTPGETVHLVATFSPAGSYTSDAINDNNQNALTAQDASSPKTYDFNTPGNPASPALSPFSFTAAVQINGSWANDFGKTFSVAVACPGGQSWNGSACVLNTCANGANNYPTCNTCTAPLTWNGASCVAPTCTPAWLCTNWSSCTAGMQTCTGATDTNSCGVSTGDPTGSSRTCTPPPPVISGFTVNPTRVRSNTPTSVIFSWSGTNLPPAGCSVSGTSINGASSPQTTNITIGQPTIYTLTCGSATAQTSVGLIPVFQEI